jgi:hypothetical protein
MPTNIAAYSKAIAAVLVALVLWANQKWGFKLPVDIETWTLIVGALIAGGVFVAPKNTVKALMPLLLIGAIGVSMTACTAAPVGTSGNTAYSPREQVETAYIAYGVVLSAAAVAVSTDKLPNDVEKKIAAVTQAATNALKKAKAEAMKCWRDQETGIVGDAPNLPPGERCDPSTAGRLISLAEGAIGEARGVMSAFGVEIAP